MTFCDLDWNQSANVCTSQNSEGNLNIHAKNVVFCCRFYICDPDLLSLATLDLSWPYLSNEYQSVWYNSAVCISYLNVYINEYITECCERSTLKEILFITIKNRAGRGGRSFYVGLIPYIYWTQIILPVYLPHWRKILDVYFYAWCQIIWMTLISFLSIILLLIELER